MPLARLDHYSVRTTRLADTERFYTEVLGLQVGPRPPFNFPGIWLYHDAQAVVHVVGIDPSDPQGLIDYLGEKGLRDADETGSIDHIAFVAMDFESMKAHFTALGCVFRERMVPAMNLAQLFVDDPNGVTIELNFPGS